MNVINSCMHTQSCLTLCDRRDCSPPGSPVHGISQAKILEWVDIFFSRESSWPRDQTCGLLRLLHWQADSLPLSHLGDPPSSTHIDTKLKKEEKKTFSFWWDLLGFTLFTTSYITHRSVKYIYHVVHYVLIYLTAGSLCLLTASIQSILFLSIKEESKHKIFKKFHSLRNKFKKKISERLILKLNV